MLSTSKRVASAAIVAATALGLVIASPAAADTVTGRWTCMNPWGGISGPYDYRITVTAPATAKVGQTVTLTASFYNVVNAGTHVEAGVWTGQLEIILGGAASGPVYANGLTNPDTAADRPLGLDGGQLQYTFTSAGDVTFKPQLIRLYYTGVGIQMCGNSATPIAATVRVT